MSYRMLSIEELASELGWTYARVYRLVRTGQIPHAKVGGRICFLKSTIDAWVKSLEQTTRDGEFWLKFANKKYPERHQGQREMERRRRRAPCAE